MSLDPKTREKIEEFGRRRRRLILLRGICAVLTILLAAMSVVAFLDWLLLLPDPARWALSALAYAAAFAAAWVTCARLVWRSPGPRELARFFEQARPELREDLLSAVELGGRDIPAWESEEFHRLLQSGVADRVRDVRVGTLLPIGRIRRWMAAAGAVVGACALLAVIPGLRFEHLLLRSLLPMANLERISRVQVEILEPKAPHEGLVPRGDTVLVRIRTDGPEHRSAWLEVYRDGKRERPIEMTAQGGRAWSASIKVEREPVEYRIRAGDALTRKYLLTPVARPEAVAFHKTYRYPAYSRKAPRRAPPEPAGDLQELEGTVVELEIEVNQPTEAAHLDLELGGKASKVELKAGPDPRRLRAELALAASGTYRVFLRSAETRFENKFSPQYEVRSMPDLVPRVTLDEPKTDQTLILPPSEDVLLKGSAKDDLGLAQVLQVYKVNQGEWKELPFEEKEFGAQYAISRRWVLFDLGLHPGDRVTTKLVAVDLKGSRIDSAPLQIEITTPGFDPNRHVPLVAREAVYDALVALRDRVRGVEKRVSEAAARAAEGEFQRTQALVNAAADAEKVAQEAEQVEARAKDALRLARPGRESDDLARVARIVRRMAEESVQGGRAEIARASATTEPALAKENLERARQAFARGSDQVSVAAEAFRELLASEEAVAALGDLRDLARDQASINRQAAAAAAAKDAKGWERLSRRQGVAWSQAETIEGVLGVLVAHAGDLGPRAQQLRQGLVEARAALKKALDGPQDKALQGPSHAMQGAVDAATAAMQGLEPELGRRAERARTVLAQRSETSTADVLAVGREADALVEIDRKVAESKAAGGDPARLESRQRRAKDQAERTTQRWGAAGAQLEARAAVEEVRGDADPFFVADSGLASRAMQAQLEAHRAAPEAAKTRETLRVVEKAYRTLETGHRLAELSAALRGLAEEERWPQANSIAPAARHPKDWAWLEGRVKGLSEGFPEAGLPAEAAKGVVKGWAGPATDAIRAEMAARAAPGRRPAGVAVHLERLGAEVGKGMSAIHPAMEEARRALRRLVPTLQERLAQLAKAAERLQKQSEAAEGEPPQVRAEAQKLLENQQALDRQVEEVAGELRRDANLQDLLTEQGRERARDADDAVAMLRDAPPKAEQALSEAAAAAQPKDQAQALDRAEEQQGKLAEALKTLAEHYENLAKEKPEETRPELRKAEEALGIKAELDRQYKQMEKLAQLAQESRAEALKSALQEEAKASEAIRRELDQLAQNALDRAEQSLNQAAETERRAARDLAAAAQQQGQDRQSMQDQARKIAEQARQMARQDVPKLAQAAPQAKAKLDPAKQNLEEGAAAVPQDAGKPEAPQQMEAAAKELSEAARDLQGAQQAAEQAAEQAKAAAASEQQQAQAAQQKSQQEAQQAQAAQAASEAAQKASQAADMAAKMAQEAAQKQPGNQDAQRTAEQAAQQAKAAQAGAQKAQASAQAEAKEAQAAQAGAAAEQQQAQAAQQAAQQSQAAAQQAGQAAQQGRQLAQQAQALAQAMKAQGAPAAMAQSQQAQKQAAEMVAGAQADIQQAARNQEAAGKGEQAQALGQVAQGVQGVRDQQLPAAAKAAQGSSPSQAAQAAQAAQKAIQQQAQALAGARSQAAAAAQGQPADGEPSALAEGAAERMAQALNALNQGPPQQGQGQGQGPPSPAQQAMQGAAQAQAQAMAQARSQGQGMAAGQGQGPGGQPGKNPFSQNPGQGKGAAVEAGRLPEGALPGVVQLRPGEWGRLPPRLARDLMEAQREAVSGEYRGMVETYFRVIAERARK